MTEKRQQPAIGSFNKAANGEGLTAVNQFIGNLEAPEKVAEVPAKPSTPVTPEPRNDAPAQEPQEPKMSVEEALETADSLDEDIEGLESAPELRYEDKIAVHGITLEKAEEIIDSMIVDGFYEETYALTKKYAVTLRTRTLEDQNRIMERIEVLKPHYPSTLSNLVAQYNVASSLVQFKGIKFLDMKFNDRLDWVRKCPDSVVRALAMKLNKFDSMITDVMSDGAIENF